MKELEPLTTFLRSKHNTKTVKSTFSKLAAWNTSKSLNVYDYLFEILTSDNTNLLCADFLFPLYLVCLDSECPKTLVQIPGIYHKMALEHKEITELKRKKLITYNPFEDFFKFFLGTFFQIF